MEETTKDALDSIEGACTKIHGVAGLLAAGDTTEELILQKVDALGISAILRDCARDIQDKLDELKENHQS